MSTQSKPTVVAAKKPITLPAIHAKKEASEPIVMLTAYDFTMAKTLDEADVDMLLVGDSVAMTHLGHPNTLQITVDEMLHHVKAVTRGAQRAMVVADMPFMSYHRSKEQAMINAARFIQEGQAQAVKLEGATDDVCEAIRHLTENGIPVVGHLGLTPQSLHTLGGYRVQGKTAVDARRMLIDAHRLQEAGVFSLVLEMVPTEVATEISQSLSIPTIGIGAGNGCDGQVLVIDDLLGRFQEFKPRFVRSYSNLAEQIKEAVSTYATEVRERSFPNNETEAFALPAEDAEEVLAALKEPKNGSLIPLNPYSQMGPSTSSTSGRQRHRS